MQELPDFGCPDGFFTAERAARGASRGAPQQHSHNSYEIYLYLGDGMSHFVEDRSYALGRNDIMLVDCHVFHGTWYPAGAKRHERILLSFDAACLGLIGDPEVIGRIQALFALNKLKFRSTADHQAIVREIRQVHESSCRESTRAGRLRSRFRLCELVLSLAELMDEGLIEADAQAQTPPERRASEVIRYLDENYADSISLQALAKQFYVGKYTLCHTFKKATGGTVLQYLNRRRLKEAGRLLMDTDATVTEISQAAGFGSLSHFNEQFRQFYGCSPSEYRQKG